MKIIWYFCPSLSIIYLQPVCFLKPKTSFSKGGNVRNLHALMRHRLRIFSSFKQASHWQCMTNGLRSGTQCVAMQIRWSSACHVVAKSLKYSKFLSRVSTLTRDIDIAILSDRLSVRPSVTFRYWMKTAELSVYICPSVCPSARDVPVLVENGLTYFHSFFHHTVERSF